MDLQKTICYGESMNSFEGPVPRLVYKPLRIVSRILKSKTVLSAMLRKPCECILI